MGGTLLAPGFASLRAVMGGLVLLAGLAASPSAGARPAEGRVVHVTDGDTVTVRTRSRELKVRLLYIDAPETGQPRGREATRHLESLVRFDPVKLETRGRDKYGRTLGHLTRHRDGLDVNREQVRAGHAWANARGTEKARYDAAEAEARAARRGLWQDDRPVHPATWRRRHAR